MNYPYSYRAFGLAIVSEIPVTGFDPAPVDTPDVVIETGTVPESLPDAVNRGVLFENNDNDYLLRIDRVARYRVTGGDHITVQPAGGAAASDVSAFLNGSSFGALPHQRRMLPLHACTVERDGKGIVVAGLSGAGKSTLAAALLHAGATLVADDISVVDFHDNMPVVRPAFPVVKIWADSLKQLGLKEEGLEPVRGELRKYYYPVERFATGPVPVSAVFILGSHNKDEVESKPLTGIDKFQALKRHTYFFRGLLKTGLEQNHFVLVNRLATAVPVTQLTRPNTGFSTNRLLNLISTCLIPVLTCLLPAFYHG
jgi:hypothetical protein